MDDITLISDPRVRSIPILECNEELVDVKDFPEFIISSKRVGIYEGFTFLRKSVARKLKEAATLLPKGIRIIFEEGHRPLSVQTKIFKDYYAELKEKHPNWDHEKTHIECTKYIAAPVGNPPHSTGGVFDISLAGENQRELDMGSSSDDTPDENGDRNFSYSKNISEKAKDNRANLIYVMEKIGFVNYPTEWWHWSYGDQYWAYIKKQDHAIYGLKEMPNLKVDLSISYRKIK